MINPVNKTITPPDGRTITIGAGRLAKQADSAVTVTVGSTVLLATMTATKDAKPDVDFMPLQVEYREKFSAIGYFPGGFVRRERRTSDYEILTCRLADRTLRPPFPDGCHAGAYVNIILFSSDGVDMPDALVGLAASAALAVSNVPLDGPISEVHVARVDGDFVINPAFEQLERTDIDLMVAATLDNIMMVGGETEEVQEEKVLEAIKAAHGAIKIQCQTQLELSGAIGRMVKREYPAEKQSEELRERMQRELYDKIRKVATAGTDKHTRGDAFVAIVKEFKVRLTTEELGEKGIIINRYHHGMEKAAMRRVILDEGKCLDGRRTDEIRPIWIETDCLSDPYGLAIFTRGETQSLSTVTLGTKSDEKSVDDVLNYGKERFLLHYNFSPFSTDEAKASHSISRREIGHGNLAHRVLKRMIPEDYPYVIRVMNGILESNSSSSVVTVCAGTLALRDAGVQMEKSISGIAMGLISENRGTNYAILSDILGGEDHLGDVGFKVTGTRDGTTATQMDTKVDGLSYEILARTLAQAKASCLHILNKIEEAQPETRPSMKPCTPRIGALHIGKKFIEAVIGPGGRIIQSIRERNGTTANVEEVDNYGIVEISSSNKEPLDAVLTMVRGIVATSEVGEIYKGTVSSVMPYGYFIQFIPGKGGLLHISKIDWKHFATTEETGLKEGNTVDVKLIEIDPKTGKFSLLHKALLPKPESYIESECHPRRERRDDGERHEHRPRRERHND